MVDGKPWPEYAAMGIPTSVRAARVLVVDDSPAFREALHELIDRTDGLVWAGETCSGEDAVKEALLQRPDVILMDVRMPGIGGIEAAARIASQPAPPVVILVTGSEPPAGAPDATAAEIIPKHRLNGSLLAQLGTAWASNTADRSETPLSLRTSTGNVTITCAEAHSASSTSRSSDGRPDGGVLRPQTPQAVRSA